jgi:hypothetical protein
MFAVSGGVLTQNSLGIGGDAAYYSLEDVFDDSPVVDLSFRGRVLESDVIAPDDPFAFAVQLDHLSQGVGIGLRSDGVVIFGPSQAILFASAPLDTSEFHDYLLRVRLNEQAWELSVDGAPLGSGATELGAFPNAMYFGDLTDGGNSRGEWTRFSLAQVPEPSAGALALVGALALCVGAALRRRKASM